jgi:translation initiation factor IF-1
MPKNTKGGNKAKKQKNSTSFGKPKDTPLPTEDENSHIAKITGILGDSRFKCKIINSEGINPTEISVHLPNSTRKFGWITRESYVKISLRDFEVNKGDILYNYNANDISYLISNGFMIETTDNKVDEELIFSEGAGNMNDDEEINFSVI